MWVINIFAKSGVKWGYLFSVLAKEQKNTPHRVVQGFCETTSADGFYFNCLKFCLSMMVPF